MNDRAMKPKVESLDRGDAEVQARAANLPAQPKGTPSDTWVDVSLMEEMLRAEQRLRQQNERLLRRNQQLVALCTKLQAEQQRYQHFFEWAPEGFVVTDLEGIIVEVNQVAATLLNTLPQLLIGQPLYSFLPEEDRSVWRRQFAQLRGAEREQDWQVTLQPKERPPFTAALLVSAMYSEQRQPMALGCIVRDVTEHQTDQRRLAVQHAVAQILAQSPALADAGRQLLQTLGEGLDWPMGLLWCVDERAHVLRCLASWAQPAPAVAEVAANRQRRTFSLGRGLPGRAWASGQPLWMTELLGETGSPSAAGAAAEGLQGLVAFPIQLGSEILGVLEFGSRQLQEPDAGLLDLMATLGSEIGQFLKRKRAEESLRQQRDFAEGLIEAAEAVVLVLDSQGQIVRFNPFFEEISGYRLGEVRGHDWFTTFVAEPDRPAFRDLFQKVVNGLPTGSHASRVQTRGPTPRVLDWRARALTDAQGTVGGVLLLGHDITQLQQAQASAMQAERLAAIGQVVAGLAHESRNALQGSRACLERLTWKLQDRPEALDLVSRIQEEQNRLLYLYEDVRGYAAPLKLRYQMVSLAAIWQEVWDKLVALTGKQAVLRSETDGVDLHCSGDRFRLEQVFRNILDNSLAAGGDTVRVDIHCSQVTLEGCPAVRVAVRDDGPGLTPEQKQKIFVPFYSTKTKGTGLGMAISKRIVEAHGGTIAVGESGGPGAEIVLILPRRRV